MDITIGWILSHGTVWWKCEVGEVNDNIVGKMVVLLAIWSNWVILVGYFNDCSNEPIVHASTWKDIPVSQGKLSSNA